MMSNVNTHQNVLSSISLRGASILQERNVLFAPQTLAAWQNRGKKKKTEKKKQPWTANFLCLSNRFTTKVPSSQEKLVLAKAGLGFKKIKLDLEDNEETVVEKLASREEVNPCAEDNLTGFPKLKEAGGFELLRCIANCRDLELMICPISA